MRDSNDAIGRLSDNKNDIDDDDTNNNIDEACEPLSVARDDRCEYVKTTPSCRLESANNAFINYRKTYYCVSNWATKEEDRSFRETCYSFPWRFYSLRCSFTC